MDMIEVKQFNEVLFQEKECLYIMFDFIGEVVVCIDMVMKIIFMNLVVEKMSGWMQEEVLGVLFLMVLYIIFGDNGLLMENIYSVDILCFVIE